MASLVGPVQGSEQRLLAGTTLGVSDESGAAARRRSGAGARPGCRREGTTEGSRAAVAEGARRSGAGGGGGSGGGPGRAGRGGGGAGAARPFAAPVGVGTADGRAGAGARRRRHGAERPA